MKDAGTARWARLDLYGKPVNRRTGAPGARGCAVAETLANSRWEPTRKCPSSYFRLFSGRYGVADIGGRVMSKLVLSIGAILVVVTGTAAPATALPLHGGSTAASMSTPLALDRDKPVRMQLTQCVDESDRDCIESIGIVTPRRFVPGEVISSGPTRVEGPIVAGGLESGPTTGQFILRNQTWRIPGLKTGSGQDTLSPFIAITTPGMRWYAADQGIEYDVTSQLEFEVTSSRTKPTQTLRAVVRTSWFSPAWARSHLGDTVLRVEALRGGGSRISVQGKALGSPGFLFGGGRDPDLNKRQNFDYYDYRWTVYMMDANDGRFPAECASHGFPLISGNQWGSGTPIWDPQAQRMDLVVSAPHYDGEGKVFRGHYEAYLPGKYARCMWRTDPSLLRSVLAIEVIAEDGDEQAVTTSIGYRDGGIRIVARNFTFSSPTIIVRRK